MTGTRRGNRFAAAGLLAAAVLTALGAAAAEPRRFAVVAPAAGTPFYDGVGDGCRRRAEALGATCAFYAPGGEEKRGQGEILRALIADRVDGIALSPALLSAVAPALAAAEAARIPVVAFDGDLPAGHRRAFVGTEPRDFGRALGASLRRWKPTGGRFALLTGDPSLPALAERVAGVRDALGPDWQEVAGSPAVTTGESREAAGLVDRLLLDHPDLDAVISVGAWPMLAEDAWRDLAGRHRERIDRARVVIVVADALPLQRRLLRDGLAHVLVGQRPDEMGARIAELLDAAGRGARLPEVVYTGFEVLTRRDLIDLRP